MKKLIKGSKKAKEFMAKIRAKKKKVSGVKESTKLKKELAKKKIRLPHGYTTVKRVRKISGLHKDTKSHNVRINVLSGIDKDLKNKYNKACEMESVFKSNIVFFKSMAKNNPEKKGYYNTMAKIEDRKLKDITKVKNKLAKFK